MAKGKDKAKSEEKKKPEKTIKEKRKEKKEKAGTYLLQSVKSMNQNRSLVNWFSPQVDENQCTA